MKLSNYEMAQIPKAKIVDYLLSPTHRHGNSKEQFFIRFGFQVDSWEVMAVALKNHAAEHEVTKIENSPFGKRYVIEGILTTPDGRNPLVRSVWFIEAGESMPRFVTAYPLSKK